MSGIERSETAKIIEALPILSPEQEQSILRVCLKGEVLELGEFPLRRQDVIGPGGLPTIEIAGVPGSGKTIASENASQRFEKLGLKPIYLPEPKIPFLGYESAMAYNSQYMFLQAGSLYKAHFDETGPKLIILDGGILKQIPFLETNITRNEIDKENVRVAEKFIVTYLSPWVDAVILCHAKAAESLKRKSITDYRPIMNPEYLTTLDENVTKLPEMLAEMRFEANLGNEPLITAELSSSNIKPQDFNELLFRTMASIVKHFYFVR